MLDRAIAQVCNSLATVSYVRAVRLNSETARLKPGSSPPEGEGKELAHFFRELYSAAKCNWDRMLVIKDAQTALRQVRYSPEKALVRGTREWKVAVATDQRISVEVACTWGVSSSYVRQLRAQLRDGKLDSRAA